MGLFSKKKKEEKAPDLDKVVNNGDGTITFFDKYGNSHTVDENVNKDEYLQDIYNYLEDKQETPKEEEENLKGPKEDVEILQGPKEDN